MTHILAICMSIWCICVGLLYYFPAYTPIILSVSLISSASCVTFSSWINSYWVVKHAEIWIKSSNRYSVVANESKTTRRSRQSINTLSVGSKSDPDRSKSGEHDGSTQITNSNDNKILSHIQLRGILENDILFQSFLEHLNEEFSLECLLSLIELIQFKQVIIQYIKDNNYNNVNDTDIFAKIKYINFPSFVPKSEIVYDDKHGVIANITNGDKWKEMKYRSYMLYIKYIKDLSEYQINISYELRSRFDNLMLTKSVWMNQWIEDKGDIGDNESEEEKELKEEDIECKLSAIDLLNMFNEVSIEMIQLLDYSFNRYKNALNDQEQIDLVYGKTQMTVDSSNTFHRSI